MSYYGFKDLYENLTHTHIARAKNITALYATNTNKSGTNIIYRRIKINKNACLEINSVQSCINR